MLYATTRDKSSVETAYKAIHLDCAGDGGLFVPYRLEALESHQIAELKDQLNACIQALSRIQGANAPAAEPVATPAEEVKAETVLENKEEEKKDEAPTQLAE